MNETIKLQLNHKTIRIFEDKKVPQEMIDSILDVANRTATGMGLQQFSIIRITDQDLKEKLAKIGGQAYIADMPEVFIFIADLYRNYLVAKEGGEESYMNSMYALNDAMADALLAAQNVNIAVESLGMGGVYLGCVLWKIKELIEVLNLPKYTFPAIGYGFGFPGQDPQLKPRMSGEFKFFENEYPCLDGIRAKLKNHDEAMSKYYDLRKPDTPLDPFTKQVIKLSKLVSSQDIPLTEAMVSQGFKLSKNT